MCCSFRKILFVESNDQLQCCNLMKFVYLPFVLLSEFLVNQETQGNLKKITKEEG